MAEAIKYTINPTLCDSDIIINCEQNYGIPFSKFVEILGKYDIHLIKNDGSILNALELLDEMVLRLNPSTVVNLLNDIEIEETFKDMEKLNGKN